VTCTGCAGIYIGPGPDGHTVGFAIGEAEATKKEGVDVSRLCSGADMRVLNTQRAYRPKVVEIANPAFQVMPASPLPQCDQSQVAFKEVTVKGGKLGSGWFGVLTTFFMAYFAPYAGVIP
jgi:hypothetical protein